MPIALALGTGGLDIRASRWHREVSLQSRRRGMQMAKLGSGKREVADRYSSEPKAAKRMKSSLVACTLSNSMSFAYLRHRSRHPRFLPPTLSHPLSLVSASLFILSASSLGPELCTFCLARARALSLSISSMHAM
eukprot:1555802-Rhodomonas_salina.2